MNGRRMRKKSEDSANGTPGSPSPGGRIEVAPPAEIDITKDRLGTVLCERRRVLGLKIEDVAEDIKVRPEYVRALEEESLDLLPTAEYARLFLKAYAERLGINVSEVYALLDLCEPSFKPKPGAEPTVQGQASESTLIKGERRRPHIGWIVGAAVIVIALLVWAMWLSREVGESGNGVEAPSGQTGGESPAAVEPPIEATLRSAPPQPEPMNLQLGFDRDTWVVLAADDDTVVNRVLHAGESVTARATGRFLLTLAHTDGVEASVNGRRLRAFREYGSRLSGVIITADSVNAWLDTATAVASTMVGDPPVRDSLASE